MSLPLASPTTALAVKYPLGSINMIGEAQFNKIFLLSGVSVSVSIQPRFSKKERLCGASFDTTHLVPLPSSAVNKRVDENGDWVHTVEYARFPAFDTATPTQRGPEARYRGSEPS